MPDNDQPSLCIVHVPDQGRCLHDADDHTFSQCSMCDDEHPFTPTPSPSTVDEASEVVFSMFSGGRHGGHVAAIDALVAAVRREEQQARYWHGKAMDEADDGVEGVRPDECLCTDDVRHIGCPVPGHGWHATRVALSAANRELSALSSDKQTLMTAATHWRERAEQAEARVQGHHNVGVVHKPCGIEMVAYHWGKTCAVCAALAAAPGDATGAAND